MKPKLRRQSIAEESVEAKPRSVALEPTSVTSEFKDLAKGTAKSAWQDLLAGSASSISEQLLGSSDRREQQLIEGQEFALEREKREEKPKITAEHLSYLRTTIERTDSPRETHVEIEIKQQVEQIRVEIRKLVKTSKLVERTVKDATAEYAPVRPGKYHLNFFEFVLSVIKDATRKLEDSVHFGAVFSSKKQQSTYWNRYKKHGTQFGLSGERTTATQTG